MESKSKNQTFSQPKKKFKELTIWEKMSGVESKLDFASGASHLSDTDDDSFHRVPSRPAATPRTAGPEEPEVPRSGLHVLNRFTVRALGSQENL